MQYIIIYCKANYILKIVKKINEKLRKYYADIILLQGVYKTKPTKFQDFSRISRSFLNSFPGFVCTKCIQ